jgi:hypothetical protein
MGVLATHKAPDGRVSVIYRVYQDFPAQEILKYVKYVLAAQHWMPLMTDWLNPDIPSSHVRGWTNWIDGTVTPNTRVHQWFADWQNEKGDVVFFEFRYDSQYNSPNQVGQPPDNSRLRVTGLLVPGELAQKMKEAAKTLEPDRR